MSDNRATQRLQAISAQINPEGGEKPFFESCKFFFLKFKSIHPMSNKKKILI